jgi:hypothetical protein
MAHSRATEASCINLIEEKEADSITELKVLRNITRYGIGTSNRRGVSLSRPRFLSSRWGPPHSYGRRARTGSRGLPSRRPTPSNGDQKLVSAARKSLCSM